MDYQQPKNETKKRYGSPTFYSLLDEMAETHDKKSHDYAPDDDPFANYKFAGFVSSMFSHSPDDAGFAGRLAEKIVRLSVLGKRGSAPRNESVADTERDIAVIATLWMAMRKDSREKEKILLVHKLYDKAVQGRAVDEKPQMDSAPEEPDRNLYPIVDPGLKFLVRELLTRIAIATDNELFVIREAVQELGKNLSSSNSASKTSGF